MVIVQREAFGPMSAVSPRDAGRTLRSVVPRLFPGFYSLSPVLSRLTASPTQQSSSITDCSHQPIMDQNLVLQLLRVPQAHQRYILCRHSGSPAMEQSYQQMPGHAQARDQRRFGACLCASRKCDPSLGRGSSQRSRSCYAGCLAMMTDQTPLRTLITHICSLTAPTVN